MSDTSLILACEDFIETYQRLVDAARDEDEEAYDRAGIAVDRLARDIASQAPTAMSGIRANARAAVLSWAGPETDFSDDDERTALTRSLLTDLAGMPDGASVVRFDPACRAVGIHGPRDWR